MDLLSPRFHVLAPDLYGSGKSPEWPSASEIRLLDEVELIEPALFSLIDADSPRPNDADGIRSAVVDAGAALDQGNRNAAAERFIDYWMEPGSWDKTPDQRKPPIAAAVANVRRWGHALFTEPTPLAAFAGLDMPVLYMLGKRSTGPGLRGAPHGEARIDKSQSPRGSLLLASKIEQGVAMAIIGIDLGTSNSAAAVLRGGRPVIIPSAEGLSIGGKAFPSYVALTADGQILVGEPARRQATANPEGTVTAFKRKMGRRETITLRGRDYSPEQLSAFLLQKIRRDAEAFLGEPVEKAVVTVPAYFDDNQRAATKDACRIAGLDVIRLVNEPTAASLAYGLDRLGEELRIAVIDLGGGTLDVTIMEFGKGVFEVKATSGDTQLGGTDMNQCIYDHLAERFQMAAGVDVRKDIKAAARLMEAAEAAKIDLTASVSTHVSLPYLAAVQGEPRHLELDLNRTELERLVRPVIDRCRSPVEQALHDAGIRPTEVDRVVFVGGPTRMPAVRSYFEEIFGHKAEMGVDPMECVAAGAAIQAGVLAGEVGGIVLVDVTPLTLGVETLGGIATPLIARNTPIPVKKTELFTTAADMQTSVTIHVFQGERPMTTDNTSLGEFNLDGLPPAPRGIPKIEVTFDIDSNGILGVSARDTASGKTQSINITASTRLPESEKRRMVEEAQRYADADRKRRDDAEKLNAADSTCYEAEKVLANFADKLTDELKKRIEAALRETKDAQLRKDAVLATERAEGLKKVLKEAGAVLYTQSGQAGKGGPYAETPWQGPTPRPDVGAAGGEPRPSGAGPRGRVMDAEYRENR